ncbi:unnamed protein product [Kuraishia capsulata CBS 1993]|uniref:Uncharacterized protein n=1 Tax=Kuraishia capsulata CBS 1993 TaxID=1382522 RepID=W6MWZ8_9ASCO|nr:uncharacterized protein KUCA_T00004016001 [Kuraishia capsulata CBS 1993]CDK28035.1 unnamed protein product [Kuraishia capsulata CBS 1993]
MRPHRLLILVLCTLASSILAEKVLVTNKSLRFCTGMYSKRDWDGDIEPHIEVDLQYFKLGNNNVQSVSIVIFEYNDVDALGVSVSDLSLPKTNYLCSEELVAKGLCDTSELYQFIVNKNVTPKAEILTSFLTSYGDNGLRYNISKTGYYCVACSSPLDLGKSQNEFIVQVNFQNSYGNLPAAEIPKLKFYGLLAVLYAVSLSVYLFQMFIHRSELLKLQKCLAGFFVFFTVESILTWFFYAFLNEDKMSLLHPVSGDVVAYKLFVSFLSALKVPLALWLLVLITAGYDLVYSKIIPKHEDDLVVSFFVGFCYFFFGLGFTLLSFYNTVSQPPSGPFGAYNDSAAGVGLWFTGILCACFYMIILHFAFKSLSNTQKVLAESKQRTKLKLYQNFFWFLCISVLLLIFATVLLIALQIGNSFTEFRNLRSLFDLLSSCIFVVVFIGVVFMFRPSHELYLLSCSGKDIENEFPEEPSVGVDSGDFELDDLAGEESARLVGSSENPYDGERELDSNNQPHNGGNDEKISPPPSYGELEHDESENERRSS